MAKISIFIIVMIVFTMVLIGGFGALMASINVNYNPEGYNESKLEAYNKLTQLSQKATDIENKTKTLQSRSGIIDVLGGFFESAYEALELSYNSMDIFRGMAEGAKEDIPALENINIFYTGAISIVIIILIFVILRVTTKGEV